MGSEELETVFQEDNRMVSIMRRGALEYFTKEFPNMPRYVLFDFVYKNFKHNPKDVTQNSYFKQFVGMKWKKEVVTVTLDMFDSETQEKIKERAGGSNNPFRIYKDAERHAKQRELQSLGPSEEPIILIATPEGYELLEGWHRTIQALRKWPKGYRQNSWIGYK